MSNLHHNPDFWVQPPSHALQRRARRRLRVCIAVIGAFGFGLAFGWISRTPTQWVCYAPTGAVTQPAPLFYCVGATR
jgi:hypothetical protein